MILKNRITLAFNKFYSNFLKDLKATDDSNRRLIKKHYKMFYKNSDEYIEYFQGEVDDIIQLLLTQEMDDLSKNESLLEKKLVKDITVKMVLDTIENDVDRSVFWNYVYILALFVVIRKEYLDVVDDSNEGEPNDDVKQVDVLFTTVLNVLSKIQQNDDASQLIEEIMDDDVKALLGKVKSFKGEIPLENNSSEETKQEMPLPFGNMQDSMICNLAKEISNEIDVSNIQVEKPEDVLKLMDFSASNNLVGDIIKKVSTKIHDKISSGELKQEELFGEAMSMMSMMNMGGAGGMGGLGNLFNNPMMGEMMKAMKKGKAVPRQDAFKKASARDRLRAKLEERKKQQNQ